MDFADDDDFDLYENDGPGYFYVEDGFDIADELTERVIPDPPGYESEGEWDRYDYWQDIEYDTDGYGDDERLISSAGNKSKRKKSQKGKAELGKTPVSKKRKADSTPASSRIKRRRLQDVGGVKAVPPVELLAVKELRPEPRVDPSVGNISDLKSVAVPSWRDLVGSEAGKRVADEVAQSVSTDAECMEGEAAQEDTMEEEEHLEEDGEEVNPLQIVLRNHLQQLGLDISAVDEGSLLRLAQSMMAKDADLDELLGTFVSSLVGEEEDEDENEDEDDSGEAKIPKGNAFGKWVSDQAKASADKKELSPKQEERSNLPPADLEEAQKENESRTLRSSKRRRESPVVSSRKKRVTRRDSTQVQA